MKDSLENLIASALEGGLAETQRLALNARLRSDPEAVVQYCQQLRVHALLAWRSGLIDQSTTQSRRDPEPIAPFPSRRQIWRWCGWAAAVLTILLSILFVAIPPQARATDAVDRMLMAMPRGDRTYAIAVLTGDAWQRMNNGATLTYQGAILHLREPAQFLLVRNIVEGGQRITGSDGMRNWDIIGNGPVKVTGDLSRFRGGLPGDPLDLPFLDLHGQLTSLRLGYDLTLSHDGSARGLSTVRARKKSRSVRGPNELVLTFRTGDGVIVSMDLIGLPRAKGGPDALRLTLVAERPLGSDFFHHESHHAPDRRVESDDILPIR